jgi:hypothetical protein
VDKKSAEDRDENVYEFVQRIPMEFCSLFLFGAAGDRKQWEHL